MKTTRVLVLSILLIGSAAAGVFAADLVGREVVDQGTIGTATGTLVYQDSEWFIDTEDGLFLVHLGNHDFVDGTGMELSEGDEATVYGFIMGQDIAAVNVTLGSEVYALRSEDGFPLWAGFGSMRNQGTGEGMGRNQIEGTNERQYKNRDNRPGRGREEA
jgi:hypothetical protein